MEAKPGDPERAIRADMRKIRKEIQARENDNRQLFKLKFYWFTGLASLLNYKLAFSLITWAILIVFWLLIDRKILRTKSP